MTAAPTPRLLPIEELNRLPLDGVAEEPSDWFFDDGELGRAAAHQAAWLLVILGLTELVLAPGAAATGLLRGRKDTRAPMVHGLVGHWAVGLPFALWLTTGLGLGVVGLWSALALGTLVTATLSLGRLWQHGRRAHAIGWQA